MAPTPRSPATVYYNSACPVCDAGICALRERLAADKEVQWVDVHQHPEVLGALGLELEAVRERLHVADGDGRMQVGADAVAAALRRVPRWGWLAAPLRWRGVRRITDLAYNAFARRLYRWNRAQGHW